MTKVPELDGDWAFITPVGNLVLTDAINREIRVNRDVFVDRTKLPRIRKRLGINTRLREIKASIPREFFDTAETFAVVSHVGKPVEIEQACLRLVRDELSILALSQLGFSRRRFTGHVGLFGEHGGATSQYVFLNKDTPAWMLRDRNTRYPGTLRLDGLWKAWQKDMFFFGLLRILSGDIEVDSAWRRELMRASTLIGQGINGNDTATSFLWNMIALETILTRRGDRFTTVLPQRIEAFLGWIGFWETENYEKRIRELYTKRCALVHDGNREDILKKDLLFSDDLLLNLLVNIVAFPKMLSSKQRLIDFADKVQCEHKLGLKSEVRPKRLTFVSTKYSKADLDEME